jgi:hypothetical protein
MTAEEKLKEIRALYDTVRTNKDGLKVSSHLRHNLEGAIYDLGRTGQADTICLSTLNRIADTLGEIERVLGI